MILIKPRPCILHPDVGSHSIILGVHQTHKNPSISQNVNINGAVRSNESLIPNRPKALVPMLLTFGTLSPAASNFGIKAEANVSRVDKDANDKHDA